MVRNSPQPDVWGSAVASGDAVKVSNMVLAWSASKPESALSFLRKCIAVLEEDLAYCAGPRPPPTLSAHPDGSAQNRCLDAFAVVLNQTCEGSYWFASTKGLQLASLQFCAVCRNVATVTLRVDDAIPRRLLAAADAPPPGRKRLRSTRVPRLRARRVMWDLPTAMELRTPLHAVASVSYMQFNTSFVDTLKGVEWPHGAHTIKIACTGVSIHRLTEGVAWPKSLEEITFGDYFDEPFREASLPESLQRLTFGKFFGLCGPRLCSGSPSGTSLTDRSRM
ncbi:unnamed protein product [Scytosiphon promiscuus]